jgi:hypothetical protein
MLFSSNSFKETLLDMVLALGLGFSINNDLRFIKCLIDGGPWHSKPLAELRQGYGLAFFLGGGTLQTFLKTYRKRAEQVTRLSGP